MTDARTGLPWSWGATDAERSAGYGCDAALPGETVALTRAVTVDAPPETTFRWLCQLKVAPYSYDWVDNRGRRSPRTLTPGAEELAVGQRFALVFTIASFEPGRAITARMTPKAERAFGPCAFGYTVAPDGPGRSRLVGRVAVPRAHDLPGRAWLLALAWGDLVMMRKQLRTLAQLSSAASSS